MTELKRVALQIPPWSAQPVREGVRVLAWFWVVISLLILPVAVFFTWQGGGIPQDYWLAVTIFAAAEVYFTILLLYVAVKGVAPGTWLPWK